MLVLSRKLGERLVIGGEGNVVLTLVDIGRGQVRIGIDAPRDVNIYREELAADYRAPEGRPAGAEADAGTRRGGITRTRITKRPRTTT